MICLIIFSLPQRQKQQRSVFASTMYLRAVELRMTLITLLPPKPSLIIDQFLWFNYRKIWMFDKRGKWKVGDKRKISRVGSKGTNPLASVNIYRLMVTMIMLEMLFIYLFEEKQCRNQWRQVVWERRKGQPERKRQT